MTTPVDDLQPIPPQPELSAGNKVFHEKSYNLYVWMRTKLAPALEYVESIVSNFMSGAYNATSTTSMVLGTGSKTITVQAGRSYVPGNPIRVAYTTDPNYYADGIVTAYNSTTGVLTFDSKVAPLTGTYANWTISIIPNSTGLATLGANEFSGSQTVPDDAYSALGWNGNNEVPTKNAVRDKIESFINFIFSGIVAVTANVTMAATEWNKLFVNSSTSTWAVTLDSVAGNANKSVQFKCDGTGQLTVNRSGSATMTVNGVASLTSFYITQGQTAWVICDGTNFIVSIYGIGRSAQIPASSGKLITMDIPAWASRIKCHMHNVSTNGSSNWLWRLNGITTGYVGGADDGTPYSYTNGFGMPWASSTIALIGDIEITAINGLNYLAKAFSINPSSLARTTLGRITLAARASTLTLTTVAGTPDFNGSGFLILEWE